MHECTCGALFLGLRMFRLKSKVVCLFLCRRRFFKLRHFKQSMPSRARDLAEEA